MKINIWETLGIDSDKAKNAVNVKRTIEEDVKQGAAETIEASVEEEPHKSKSPEELTEEIQEPAVIQESLNEEEIAATEPPEEAEEPEASTASETGELAEAPEPQSAAEIPSDDTVSPAEEQKQIWRDRLLSIFDSVSARISAAKEETAVLQEEKILPAEEDTEIKPEPEVEAEVPDEASAFTEETEEPEKTQFSESKQPLFTKEKLVAASKLYGWVAGIAAAFTILIGFMVVYTTMTPREIHATIDGEQRSITSEAYTIEKFLEEENIALCEEDYISMPTETFIYDGMEFELQHATDFKVTADGRTKAYKSLDGTVGAALEDVGIKVGDIDIVTPKANAYLTQDLSVVVQRVVIEEETIEEEVAFKTVEKDDTTMNQGESKVVKKGKKGKDNVTYEIKYIDGKEASRKEIAREVITKPKKQVVANGTRVVYNGKSYSRKLVVRAYAYTGGGTTAMGTPARVGEIAVDPSVIPLGTNVYIEGVGTRRAEDTGGNIKGNTIDIYMSSQAECLRWGVRYVTIYIE